MPVSGDDAIRRFDGDGMLVHYAAPPLEASPKEPAIFLLQGSSNTEAVKPGWLASFMATFFGSAMAMSFAKSSPAWPLSVEVTTRRSKTGRHHLAQVRFPHRAQLAVRHGRNITTPDWFLSIDCWRDVPMARNSAREPATPRPDPSNSSDPSDDMAKDAAKAKRSKGGKAPREPERPARDTHDTPAPNPKSSAGNASNNN